jgi:L-threonylcarbamoyladenylate synthase
VLQQNQIKIAVQAIKSGKIIVYPTESVYGLGCDPFNESAVMQLLSLKRRSPRQGLIIIASHIRQVLPLIKPIEANDLARALKTWPGHNTWVFPKSNLVPYWISGEFDSIAVRVSKHPIVVQLCEKLNMPLVSTSANRTNQAELISIKSIKQVFGDKIQHYLEAPVGEEEKPSPIRDAHTLKIIR